jgi:hypothetical protein
VDEVREPGELVGVGGGDHAVTQVEHVSAGSLAGVEDLRGPPQHHLGRCEHQGRVEVALDGAIADLGDARGQRGAPVDADDVGARLSHQRQQVGRADAEVDARDPEAPGPLEHGGRVRHHVLAIVVRGQGPGPRVEELHGRGTRSHLDLEIGGRDAGDLAQ